MGSEEEESKNLKELHEREIKDGEVGHTLDAVLESFEEYVVAKHIGSRQKARQLREDVRKLMNINFSPGDAWSVVISVVQWAQARTELKIAICALAISVGIGGCSLLVGLCSLLVDIWQLGTGGNRSLSKG